MTTAPTHPNQAADTVNAVMETASRVTHRAADAVVDHVVRPMADAARTIEERAGQTNRFLADTLHDVEEKARRNPAQALGYAVGFGLLLGLWLRRK